MRSTQKVSIQYPHPPAVEQALSEEEEIIPLDGGLVMDMYNLTYDEIHKNIVQARKKIFLYDLAYPAFIRERVIVTYTRRNMNVIATANLSFA